MPLPALAPLEGHTLPLVCRPAGDASLDALISGIRGDPGLADALVRAGAVLFRGWDIADAPAVERVALAIDPDLKSDYLGTSPRNALTKHVFTASELPGHYPIAQHNEMSFLRHPPRRLFFACLVPNRAPGGETPLCDMRHVYRDLDPAVRARFEQRGIRIVRNYAAPGESSRFDPWKLKPWPDMFGSTDRDVVNAKCAEEGFSPTWLPGGRLRLESRQPAAKPHPQTGEMTWFNHTQVFHRGSAPAEYRRIAGRLGPKWRAWGAFASALLAAKRLTQGPDDDAMHCTFDDGAPIPDADMEAVRDAIWRNLVVYPWQKGDFVAIDNNSVAHGRLPYAGERLVVVAWA